MGGMSMVEQVLKGQVRGYRFWMGGSWRNIEPVGLAVENVANPSNAT